MSSQGCEKDDSGKAERRGGVTQGKTVTDGLDGLLSEKIRASPDLVIQVYRAQQDKETIPRLL